MNAMQRKYPIGIQTFERLIEENYIYVDKTDLVWKLTHASPFIFLSRPRRFGKSLLTTTLKSYFRGDRRLFEGLKIMELEQDWKSYPVLHLDMSTCKGQESPQMLQRALLFNLRELCREYGADCEGLTPGQCLKELITQSAMQSGGKTVVLIDEYDAPLLEVMHEQENLDGMRKVMQEFYQPLKACEGVIQFCFLTGITKFSQLSIFSTLNNIMNISMMPEYSALCGITESELTGVLNDDIDMLAEAHGCSHDEMHAMLKRQYDGYRFTKNSEEIYNPYSLMNCFYQKDIKNYWFESGTPPFLFHQMRRFGTDITKMDEIVAAESDFYLPTENLTDAKPLLYQAGYLTIKDYDRDADAYRLCIPNQEVRIGLAKGLTPFYTGLQSGDVQLGCAYKIWKALKDGDIDLSLRELKAFLAGVPYVEGFKEKLADAATKEGFYEYTFYLILSMLNVYVQTQVKCRTGRIDMMVHTTEAVYLFEFKVKSTARAALEQIEDKGYADMLATDGRKVVKVGVNFDIENWTIEDWAVADNGKK